MLIELAGRRIYYDLAGAEKGPVVCFTHSLASDSGMWAEQLPPLLAAGYRVLRLDMRGHGGSDPVAGDYTMAALADDVAAALDFLGISRVHLVGLSIGGMLGQAFAVAHGQRLLSAMLCDTAPQTPPGAQEAWAPRIAAVKNANALAPLADPTMERWFTDAFKPRNPGRWKQIHATIAATSPAGYLGCAAAILDFDFVPRLPSLKVPTLVVCGADDQGTPPAGNKRIAELVPGGRYQEIANARHFPNVEHPDVFNGIMLGWLNAQR
ncbi:MAG: alpha/beta fold hydrolase [Hyphomicrobiaceae bacterium]|nr:MAG: alpha/beta fold hydrolase [Hyphomicrobiaceae bacterium]